MLPFRKPRRRSSRAPRPPVSSQVSQLPHGVTPPAQLRIVPARLDHDASHLPRLRVEDQVGGAAAARRRAGGRVGDVGPVVDVRRAGAAFVVADQHDPARARRRSRSSSSPVTDRTRSLPARRRRRRSGSCPTTASRRRRPCRRGGSGSDAIRHYVAGPAVGPVAEAVGQLQQLEARRLVLLRADGPYGLTPSMTTGPRWPARAASSCSDNTQAAPAPIAPRRRNVRRSVLTGYSTGSPFSRAVGPILIAARV